MIRKILVRAGLLVMAFLLPVAMLIDIAIGDIMTGVKTTPKAKIIEQCKLWIELWREA